MNNLREPSDVAFPERLARVHNDFERIHPFLDGNGRTGRLLLNLLLVRLGYPPAIVFKNERTKYLDAMRKADRGDDGPLGELIARAVTNNLYRFVVPAVAGPARLVPLASLVDEKSGVTATALRAAAERGRLRARKSENGTWLSSKKWVADYQKYQHKRGGNPAKGWLPDKRLTLAADTDDPSPSPSPLSGIGWTTGLRHREDTLARSRDSKTGLSRPRACWTSCVGPTHVGIQEFWCSIGSARSQRWLRVGTLRVRTQYEPTALCSVSACS